MRKVEQILIAAVVIGFSADYFLVPYARWLFIIGIAFLSNIYLFDFKAIINDIPLSVYNQKNRPRTLDFHSMFPGFSIVAMMLGMLFNFKTWPGGNTILAAGFGVGLFSVYQLMRNRKSDPGFTKGAVSRIVIYAVFGVFFYLLPPYFWIEKVYHNYPDYIEARKAFDRNPEDEALRIRMEEAYEKTK